MNDNDINTIYYRYYTNCADEAYREHLRYVKAGDNDMVNIYLSISDAMYSHAIKYRDLISQYWAWKASEDATQHATTHDTTPSPMEDAHAV